MPNFRLNPAYTPTADQPTAIAGLSEGLQGDERFLTLLGATGTGKTFTMAGVIEQVQRPALVIAHNKTLAAQLCASSYARPGWSGRSSPGSAGAAGEGGESPASTRGCCA
jgi:excinuclease UvrABC helicase subunit UvrB